ncbi:hypothetical protein PVAG01_08628 [Phlyctema vagabunda]|uniref:Uncharacterized protein n=1 Tax=Phlyctema vagabunda TaxID=108571 RepID=A0ABR4P9Y5_9HELO
MASTIFQTFRTEADLAQGLCVLRSLGGGLYEVVNLQKVSLPTVSSEEMGAVIRGNQDRRAALDINPKVWEEVQLKALQGVRSADRDIFRFEKLSVELRYMIYDHVLVAKKAIGRLYRTENGNVVSPSTLFNHNMLKTSRMIREEGMRFLYQNNFHLTYDYVIGAGLNMLREEKTFADNIKEVTYTWAGKCHDRTAFEHLTRFPQLEKLHIIYCDYVSMGIHSRKPQVTYQDHPSTTTFRHVYGFDPLCELRGLKEVTLEGHHSSQVDKQTHKNFEQFLKEKLTEPKLEPVEEVPAEKVTLKRRAKPIKRKTNKRLRLELQRDVNNLS